MARSCCEESIECINMNKVSIKPTGFISYELARSSSRKLIANIMEHHIEWAIIVSRYTHDTWDCRIGGMSYQTISSFCSYNLGNEIENESFKQRRFSSKFYDFHSILKVCLTSNSASLVWRLFIELFYPDNVEDRYNTWVKENFPELHELIMDDITRKKIETVNKIIKS